MIISLIFELTWIALTQVEFIDTLSCTNKDSRLNFGNCEHLVK